MRGIGLFFGAFLVAAILVYPASAERGSWNNWHVHDGRPNLNPDPTGLTHAGVAFFPQIFENYAATSSLWAYCTDATDKSLVGGDGGAKFAAGQCRNEAHIIHLQWVPLNAEAPEGWTGFVYPPFPNRKVYYRLTPR